MPRILANILDHILNRFVIFLVVNLKSETSTLLHDYFSQKRRFFADTSCKDQCINFAPQFDVITADEANDAVNENIKC